MSWIIHADIGRERPVIDNLKRLVNTDKRIPKGVTLKEERMYTADFGISIDGKLLAIIERKTWSDLAATIGNEQRKSNHKKLIEARTKVIKEDKVDCKVYYIIEGASAFPRDSISGFSMNCFMGFFNKVIINDDCHVLYSDSHEGTAIRIISLVKSYDKLRAANLLRNVKPKERKRKNVNSNQKCATSSCNICGKNISGDDYDTDMCYDDGYDDDFYEDNTPTTSGNAGIDYIAAPAVTSGYAGIDYIAAPVPVPAQSNSNPRSYMASDNVSNAGSDNTNVTSITNAVRTTNALTERPAPLSVEENRDKCMLKLNGVTFNNLPVMRSFGLKAIILGKLKKEELSKLTYPITGEKFDAVCIAKLMDQSSSDIYRKVLNEIRGVSKELASTIVSSYSITDLYKIDTKSLSLLKRSHGAHKQIGIKLAAYIIDVING